MNSSKYTYSIFDFWDKPQKILDTRAIESKSNSPIPFAEKILSYTSRDLKKIKSKGFPCSEGIELMHQVQQYQKSFDTSETIILIDEAPYLISLAVWQHYRPTSNVLIYQGGTKRLNQESIDFMKRPFSFVTLFGKTGAGKTELLRILESKGAQTLDLESIARHKGSVFGNLEEKEQLSQDSFIWSLAHKLASMDLNKVIFVEAEKFNLGKNMIPLPLLDHMENAKKIRLTLPKPARIQRIIQQYAKVNDPKLASGIEKLKFKLGKSNADQALQYLREKNYEELMGILVDYFDQSESYNTLDTINFDCELDNQDMDQAADLLIRKFY